MFSIYLFSIYLFIYIEINFFIKSISIKINIYNFNDFKNNIPPTPIPTDASGNQIPPTPTPTDASGNPIPPTPTPTDASGNVV